MENFNHRGNDFRRGPQRMLHLSAEEQQTFRRNAERWLQMNPQQRNVLRERDRILRQRMKSEAELLRDSGLRLDNGAREQFEERATCRSEGALSSYFARKSNQATATTSGIKGTFKGNFNRINHRPE